MDDEEILRELYVALFGKMGFVVVTAADGEAIEIY